MEPNHDLLAEVHSLVGKYKHCQKKIDKWLGDTAIKYDHKPPPEKTLHSYRIETAQFVPIANCISRNNHETPQCIKDDIDDVLSWRRKCGEYFNSLIDPPQGLVTEIDGHEHFLGILEQLRDILCPEILVGRLPAADQGISEDQAANESTTLEYKDEFEISNTNLPDSPISTPKSPEVSKELTDDEKRESEFRHATEGLFREIASIRNYIRDIWKSYRDDRGELMTVAVATNTAIRLVRCLEQRFESNTKRPESYPAKSYPTGCLPAIYHHWHAAPKIPLKECLKARLTEETRSIAVDECNDSDPDNICLFKPYFVATRYTHFIRTAKRPPRCFSSIFGKSVAGIYGFQDESLVQEFVSSLENSATLWEALPFLGYLAVQDFFDKDVDQFAADELLKGIRHMTLGASASFKPVAGLTPIWILFALQCHIEIEKAIGAAKNAKNAPLQDLRAQIRKGLRAHKIHVGYVQRCRKTPGSHVWNSEFEDEFDSQMAKIRDITIEDKFSSWLTHEQKKKKGQDALKIDGPRYWLHRNPLRCGTLKHFAVMQFHHLSLKFVSMTPNYVFDLDGDLPRKIESGFKKAHLAAGASKPSSGTGNRPKRTQIIRIKNRIRRKVNSNLLSNKFFENHPGVVEDQKVLDGLKTFRASSGGYKRIMETYTDLEYWGTNQARRLNRPKAELEPQELLKYLVDGLNTEMPGVCLDLLELHRQCFGLFEKLKTTALPRSCQTDGTKYGQLTEDWRLSEPFEMGLTVLDLASNVRLAPKLIRDLKKFTVVDRSLLESFSHQVKKILKNQGGDLVCLRLKSLQKEEFGHRFFTGNRLRRYGIGSPQSDENDFGNDDKKAVKEDERRRNYMNTAAAERLRKDEEEENYSRNMHNRIIRYWYNTPPS